MNKNLMLSLLTTAAILAIAAGAYMLLRDTAQKPAGQNENNLSGKIEEVDPSIANNAGNVTNGTEQAGNGRKKPRLVRVNSRDALLERTDLNETERAQLLAINDALDSDNLEDLLKILPDAAVSTNVEVRSDLVDALGWFGKSAIIDLLPFMADPDEEVAQAAMDHWTTALGEINNERRRCELVEKALTILSNEEALEAMLLEISDCDDLLVMQTLINVIEADGASAASTKVALSHYEFTTGEKYTTFENAEAWLAENYDQPDEDDDDEPAQKTVAQNEPAQDEPEGPAQDAQEESAQDEKEEKDVAERRSDDSRNNVIGSSAATDANGERMTSRRDRDMDKDDLRPADDDSDARGSNANSEDAGGESDDDSDDDNKDDADANEAIDGDMMEEGEEEDEDLPRILPAQASL